MSETTRHLGRASQILTTLEEVCQAQGVEFFDAFMDFLMNPNAKGKEKDRLLQQLAMVPATGSFRTLYDNLRSHPAGPNLRVIAPLERLKITFSQADRLAEVQHWQLLPEPTEWHGERYAGVFELLQRALVPYRLVFFEAYKDDKYQTWRPGKNLGGQVDENEYFGPQDAIVLID